MPAALAQHQEAVAHAVRLDRLDRHPLAAAEAYPVAVGT
jgi:hypothetical protein